MFYYLAMSTNKLKDNDEGMRSNSHMEPHGFTVVLQRIYL